MIPVVRFSSGELGTLNRLVEEATKQLDLTHEVQPENRVKQISSSLYNLFLACSKCSVSIQMPLSCYAALVKLSKGETLTYKDCSAISILEH